MVKKINKKDDQIDIILDKLKTLWKLVPDERLGQMFENYLLSNENRGDETSAELFFTSDSIYEKRIDKQIKVYKKRR